ncbi:MucR family transcriptional regulator [Methylobacterium sp. J-048]|uniref:MucR family transcriptional regulator n=1 Tax=Methylobacterium sp. J-048 TaxID=2836635 RepID=UPI001FB95A79|nr:MucR family transcriptional regulator [Methylobacterium sp. J-048]MCJ2056923.1 MucR family transcriptional regulator [Methylobacterium sp. J-048]
MEDHTTFPQDDQVDTIALTADIVSAYVSNNSVPVLELPTLLSRVHEALAGLGQAGAPAEPEARKLTPGQVRKSITPDALISFIDGKPYKTLKRHLTGHGLTIEAYRDRFGLPRDYPATAANYSAMRAEFARTAGLGHKRRKPAQKAAETGEAPAKPARGRKPA